MDTNKAIEKRNTYLLLSVNNVSFINSRANVENERSKPIEQFEQEPRKEEEEDERINENVSFSNQ